MLATCPRPHHVIKPVETARAAVATLRDANARALRAAVLFGPERAGLENDDVACADTLVRYPLNPAHMSLNLAQAVIALDLAAVDRRFGLAAEPEPRPSVELALPLPRGDRQQI